MKNCSDSNCLLRASEKTCPVSWCCSPQHGSSWHFLTTRTPQMATVGHRCQHACQRESNKTRLHRSEGAGDSGQAPRTPPQRTWTQLQRIRKWTSPTGSSLAETGRQTHGTKHFVNASTPHHARASSEAEALAGPTQAKSGSSQRVGRKVRQDTGLKRPQDTENKQTRQSHYTCKPGSDSTDQEKHQRTPPQATRGHDATRGHRSKPSHMASSLGS